MVVAGKVILWLVVVLGLAVAPRLAHAQRIEVKAADLGLGEHLGSGAKDTEVHGAGLVFPAGRHFLERYANALADGNMTTLTDGSHGYLMWPPTYLREFAAEYRAMPDMGMAKLEGTGDPVAL